MYGKVIISWIMNLMACDLMEATRIKDLSTSEASNSIKYKQRDISSTKWSGKLPKKKKVFNLLHFC